MADLTLEQVEKKLRERGKLGLFGPSNQNATIQRKTWEDTFREGWQVGPIQVAPSAILRGGLVNLGRIAGGTVPAPTLNPALIAGGALAGGTAVDLAYQKLQGAFPKALGAPPSSLGKSFKQAGFNTILDAAASGLINKITTPLSKLAIKDRLKFEFLNKYFPQKPDFPAEEALRADPNFPNLTVPQATDNELAATLTNIFTPQRRMQKIYSTQKDYLNREASEFTQKVSGGLFSRPTPRFDAARLGSSKAKVAYKSAEKIEDDLYTIAEKQLIPQNKANAYRVVQDKPVTLFDPSGRPVTTPGKPTLEPIVIDGPVYPAKANSFANTVIEDIDSFIKDPTNALGRDPDVLTSLNQIRDRLITFRNVAVDDQGRNVISYKSAKNTKMILTDLFEKAPEGIRKRFSATIYALRNVLGEDIKDSSATWNKSARDALAIAYRKTKSNIQKYESAVGKKVVNRFDDTEIMQEDVIKDALLSRQGTAAYINAVGGRREIGTHYLKDIMDKAYDVNGDFTAEKAIELLNSTDEIARTALSSDQRTQLTFLLRKMQLVPSHDPTTGKVAVNIRRAGATIGLAGAAAASAATGSLKQGIYTYGTLLLTFGLSKKVIHSLMLTPQNARMLARLTTLPPESSTAQSIVKSFLKGPLKGVQFSIQYANGTPAGNWESKDDGKFYPSEP